MHLLLAQKGALADADEAIDLGQSPADIVFISAADTELASLSAALRGLDSPPTLRLANLMALSHPMSIDVYASKTIAGSRAVVARVLGGESYWPYGLEVLQATCLENRIPLVVLPGDDKPDPTLDRFNTIEPQARLALWEYLNQGGADNAASFLRVCQALALAEPVELPAAAPLLKAGLWWPGLTNPSLEQVKQNWEGERPVVAMAFYRALVLAGSLVRPVLPGPCCPA